MSALLHDSRNEAALSCPCLMNVIKYLHGACLKFIVIGSRGVSQTSLRRRFIDDPLLPENALTIGVEHLVSLGKLYISGTIRLETVGPIAQGFFRHAV
jgi:hypothetical protein